jgi:uncharacterized short protein YbdD (DUF466 family)
MWGDPVGPVTLEAAGAAERGRSLTASRNSLFRSFSALLRFQGDIGWTRLIAVLKVVTGMPDYRAHLEHLRGCHPGYPLPSEREFFEEFLRARYGDGPTRCC